MQAKYGDQGLVTLAVTVDQDPKAADKMIAELHGLALDPETDPAHFDLARVAGDETRLAQRPGEVGHPGGRPVAGNFSAAGPKWLVVAYARLEPMGA